MADTELSTAPDNATRFSLTYLDILEKRLDFIATESGAPFSHPYSVNFFSLQRLKLEMDELFADPMFIDAINASTEYSNGDHNIQTAAFGLVDDFFKCVKVGFLTGNRTILWDLIGGRLLSDIKDDPSTISTVVQVARNLLLLREIVKKGGLVILPHPTSWNEETAHELLKLKETPYYSNTNFGLISSLSVMNIIPHHPYTLFPGKSIDYSAEMQLPKEFSAISEEDYLFAKAMTGLFEDERFLYLNEAAPYDFYKAVTNDKHFYAEIQAAVTPTPSSDPSRLRQDYERRKEQLSKRLKARNRFILNDLPTAGLTLMASGFAWLSTNTTGDVYSRASAALGAAVGIYPLIKNAIKKNNSDILVGAFQEIAAAPSQPEYDDLGYLI